MRAVCRYRSRILDLSQEKLQVKRLFFACRELYADNVGRVIGKGFTVILCVVHSKFGYEQGLVHIQCPYVIYGMAFVNVLFQIKVAQKLISSGAVRQSRKPGKNLQRFAVLSVMEKFLHLFYIREAVGFVSAVIIGAAFGRTARPESFFI